VHPDSYYNKKLMEFIRNLAQLRPRHKNCVATIGNFDGVHLGHQKIIRQLEDRAHTLQLPTTVIIFEPQPQEFFIPHEAPARLTRLREKLLALRRYDVDRVLCLRFTEMFAKFSAQDFIQHILVEGLGVKHLVVGDDFHFGHQRQGNFQTLLEAGQQYNFNVESQHTFIFEKKRVSSTSIRQVLSEGNIEYAATLLGRPFSLCGRVRHGQKLGRTIGFPTANIFLHRHISPLQGVYAVKMHGVANIPVNGVANLGMRPTVNGKQLLLEVHLFNFNQSIYGVDVEVEFVTKLRDEKKFNSFEELKTQIYQDVDKARSIFMS